MTMQNKLNSPTLPNEPVMRSEIPLTPVQAKEKCWEFIQTLYGVENIPTVILRGLMDIIWMRATSCKDDYVKTDLRRRFDEAGKDYIKAIEIIEEAIDFGFTELADQMINDGCVEDDFKSFWNRRKAQIYREMAEGNDPTEREIEAFVHASNGHEL